MTTSLIHLKDAAVGKDVDLSDLAGQVDAIRLIHEKLHQKEDISRIDMRPYIHELLDSVFAFSPNRVRIKDNVQDISMQTRTAIPLGLIINELATNALKHGFLPEEEAEFFLSLEKDRKTGCFFLTVSNSGAAFPEDVELDNPETLGLQLITALTDQLNGTVELQRTPRTRFILTFPG
jgi:two-component sensor histidine kinase